MLKQAVPIRSLSQPVWVNTRPNSGVTEISKNSIIKQFQYLLKIDNVELDFTKNAIDEIIRLALERNTGARALRSILEKIMIDIMYEIPLKNNVKSCIITYEAVRKKSKPKITYYNKTA